MGHWFVCHQFEFRNWLGAEEGWHGQLMPGRGSTPSREAICLAEWVRITDNVEWSPAIGSPPHFVAASRQSAAIARLRNHAHPHPRHTAQRLGLIRFDPLRFAPSNTAIFCVLKVLFPLFVLELL